MYKAKHSKETQAALAAAAAKKAKAAIAAELAKRKDTAPLKSTVELARLREAVKSLYGKGMEKKEESQVLDFKLLESLAVLDKLKADKIISDAEYKGAERLLRNVDSPLSFVEASKGIRFHILRWKPMEILDGIKTIRGYSIRLEDALASGGMVKLDLIASVAPSAEFTEFSVIYNLYMGKKHLTPIKTRAEIEEDLKEDIIYYNHRSPFKALKRAFSLAKMKNQYSEIAVLLPILNSDLGRLYQIVGDLESLHTLLEQGNPPLAEIRDNLSEMKARMGSIYSLKEFLDAEHSILGRIESMQRLQTIKALKPAIYSLHTELQKILNEATLKKIYSIK